MTTTFFVFINGYNVNKKFSKQILLYICPKLKYNVDWDSSTRNLVCVLNRHAYLQLLKCHGRFFWPHGQKIVCQPWQRKYSDNDDYYKKHHVKNENCKRFECCTKPKYKSEVVIPRSRNEFVKPTKRRSSFSYRRSISPLDELKSYARNNGYENDNNGYEDEIFEKEIDYEDNRLEEGEIVENEKCVKERVAMSSLDKRLQNINFAAC
ncbi:lef6 [Oxyplax ochracea nucleopolyhedrovirus]|uniref:Lef6 n=1 Tax=Oxyplax ochracea nucleopolyhedrovirus TaxID=2083176 RepID=A0A2L0WU81_9ABAC|nr:lef6 [Oxyplax ochracea nucleopolyhedrovirus]AVA31209.1 lef6 [Oxyplax ochracea nucleopolyhedrovirus]